MSIIGNSYPGLIDAYKGSTEGAVIELLSELNPVLDDAIATECNMGTTHRHTIRTGYPKVVWGRLYQGVPSSKSTMQQVEDTTGFVEARSEIDVRLLKLSSDPAKMRLIDSSPYLETMSQEMASGIFYNDTALSPEKFKGLSARYNVFNSNGPDLSRPDIANQVIDCGGRGLNNTSVWFVNWSDRSTSLLYPKGTKAGVLFEDKGEQSVLDTHGNAYFAKVSTFEWHIGMFVKDWRYNARIANIDVDDLRDGKVDMWAFMRHAYYRLQSRRVDAKLGRLAIYMNREVLEILDAQSSDRSLLAANPNYTGLSHGQVEGREVRTYRGIPIRECDAILNTEAPVPSVSL
ncbi:MAG: hypothetical protein JSC189_001028 [Candidatus Tokpelaia sp. JSC189]|nr:MAG: hypothetical protein JSC189_001028 [Candidatus Tokpelaia sp. JSC189]